MSDVPSLCLQWKKMPSTAMVTLVYVQDDGFAPAVAFQTMAAEGISGLLCAQLQALVQTALRPLAR